MSLEAAATLLKSRNTEDRIRAVNRIAASSDPGRIPLLLKALEDRSHYVATLAAEALSNESDWDALKAMEARFAWICEDGPKRDPGCHIRGALALAFGKQEHHSARELLEVGIHTVQIEAVGGVPFDTGAYLRGNCALALAQLRAPDALRDISMLLFDMDSTIEPRKAAARALSILGDPNGLVPLAIKLKYSEDEQPEVLQEVIQALVELEDPRAIETLEPFLDGYDRHLGAFAAVMLARTRDPAAAVFMAEKISRFSGDPLRAVALALATMRIEEARAAVIRLLGSAVEPVRLALIEALTGTRERAERECLEKLASGGATEKVRAAAAAAISE